MPVLACRMTAQVSMASQKSCLQVPRTLKCHTNSGLFRNWAWPRSRNPDTCPLQAHLFQCGTKSDRVRANSVNSLNKLKTGHLSLPGQPGPLSHGCPWALWVIFVYPIISICLIQALWQDLQVQLVFSSFPSHQVSDSQVTSIRLFQRRLKAH